MLFGPKLKASVIAVILLALCLAPVPLRPPHRLADAVQSALGFNWKLSYLFAAVSLQILFYGSLGVLSAWSLPRASTVGNILLQATALPLMVILTAIVVRSIKLGHLPLWTNTSIPVIACLCGGAVGVGLHHRKWTTTCLAATVIAAASLWGLHVNISAELSHMTELCLIRLVAAGKGLTSDEARFAELIEAAFAPTPSDISSKDSIRHNRAAILALGIAIGHERLAPLVGLQQDTELVRLATSLRPGTQLRGREDWARHYTLSAALAVIEHPRLSDAGGLLKEQLDALPNGSGFSFGDLIADRAGVRFATVATRSETSSKATQARLRSGFVVDDFFPPAADLPENLTAEEFRSNFGQIGSQRYRHEVKKIESRLDRCAGLMMR